MNRKSAGQFLGAISVILSLLFVAYEIRQNTTVARMAARHAIMAQRADWFLTVSTDPLLAPLLAAVDSVAIPQDFDLESRIRLQTFIGATLSIWEGVYASVDEGVLPDDALSIIGGSGELDTPFFRSLWPDLRGNFSQDFVEYLEALEWMTD